MQTDDNRAVSALFRVFGGGEDRAAADKQALSGSRGMHLGEFQVLSILVPLTSVVAFASVLATWWNPWIAWIAAVPVAFVALNLLTALVSRKSKGSQWQVTLAACTVWAAFHCRGVGFPAVVSYLWIGLAVINTVAALVMEWRESMAWTGWLGIAWRVSVLLALHGIAVAIGWKWGWSWAVLGGATIAGFWSWAVFRPGCQWLGPVFRTTDDDKILVTIDDGPDPSDTPVMLDLLDRHQVKAIFFMIGEKVRSHPELAREVIRRGHEIGNHTLSHPQAGFWAAGPWRTRREIADAQQVIEEVTGVRPRWFRAPVGHRNMFTHPIAATLGLRVMAWNRRGFDAVSADSGKVLARIVPELAAGDIVMIHEATPIAKEVLSGVLEAAGKLP